MAFYPRFLLPHRWKLIPPYSSTCLPVRQRRLSWSAHLGAGMEWKYFGKSIGRRLYSADQNHNQGPHAASQAPNRRWHLYFHHVADALIMTASDR